jgi:electron transfer flavoprotein beta subunit
MKIGVLVKQVQDTESRIDVKPDGSGIIDDGNKLVINPYDEYAVEEAVAMRDAVGGEVVVVTAGPAEAVDAMRHALAMGADRGIRAETESLQMDSYATAKVIFNICADESFDIIFAGKRALDDDCGQVHIGVAEMLSIPHISPVEWLELAADSKSVRLKRPIAGGKKEVIEASLPAVIGCEKGLNVPRYTSLPNVLRAKSKPITILSAGELLGNNSERIRISGYSTPVEKSGCHMIEGDAESVANELVRLLREEAKVI